MNQSVGNGPQVYTNSILRKNRSVHMADFPRKPPTIPTTHNTNNIDNNNKILPNGILVSQDGSIPVNCRNSSFLGAGMNSLISISKEPEIGLIPVSKPTRTVKIFIFTIKK